MVVNLLVLGGLGFLSMLAFMVATRWVVAAWPQRLPAASPGIHVVLHIAINGNAVHRDVRAAGHTGSEVQLFSHVETSSALSIVVARQAARLPSRLV